MATDNTYRIWRILDIRLEIPVSERADRPTEILIAIFRTPHGGEVTAVGK